VGILLPPELLAEVAHLVTQLLDERRASWVSMLTTTFGLRVGVPSVVGLGVGGVRGCVHEHVHPAVLPLLRADGAASNALPDSILAHAE
jgi:hypothetical protein